MDSRVPDPDRYSDRTLAASAEAEESESALTVSQTNPAVVGQALRLPKLKHRQAVRLPYNDKVRG
jgi:hypothetical protein